MCKKIKQQKNTKMPDLADLSDLAILYNYGKTRLKHCGKDSHWMQVDRYNMSLVRQLFSLVTFVATRDSAKYGDECLLFFPCAYNLLW